MFFFPVYFCFIPLPSAYIGNPASFVMRKIVVLRAFLGLVPECFKTWDRDSCGLFSRGSATIGISVTSLPFPSPFSALSLYGEPYAYLPGCSHPTSPLSKFVSFTVSLSGRGQLPFASLPASLVGVWASTLCGKD